MSHTIIAIDAGGTKISAALVSPKGKILKKFKIPTEASKGKEAVMANLVKSIESVWQKDVKAIGIGMAGLIDAKKGIFRAGPNFPTNFRDVPLAALLKKRFKKPVFLDNDVHCFTLAEAKFGAAKRKSSVIGITLGTGIGGGIVVDGTLYRGRDNAAGEIGHTTIGLGSKAICGCGKPGHFEAYASGSAMSRLYKDITGKSVEPLEVEKAANNGDVEAKNVFDIMSTGLAEGLANIIHLLNPDIVVVGGGLAHVDILWKPAMNKLPECIIFPELRNTPVVRSVLGGDANLLGAALITKKL
jgi:glucokinase